MPFTRDLRNYVDLLDRMQSRLKSHAVSLKDVLARGRGAGELRLILVQQRVGRKANSRVIPGRCHRKRNRLERLLKRAQMCRGRIHQRTVTVEDQCREAAFTQKDRHLSILRKDLYNHPPANPAHCYDRDMTQLDVLYRYGAAPSESASLAMAKVREVYGVRRMEFDEAKKTVRVEYDATRLDESSVEKLLRSAGVDFLTIGQYLQPTPKHHPVLSFVTPDEFAAYATIGASKGFLLVSATPLTRSSHHAGEDFARLKAARIAQAGALSIDPEGSRQ